nr:SDR family NAD(P)-dependent oxidoreductase [Desulfobacterales bacterium]
MSEYFRLDHEVAVVTGVLGKLGPIWTRTLLDAGARVMGIDHPDQKPGEAFQALQKQYGPEQIGLARADVTKREELERACTHCQEIFGTASILVNNAGIDQPPNPSGGGYRLEDIPLEINRRVLEVNTLGLFLVSQIFGAAMVKAGC